MNNYETIDDYVLYWKEQPVETLRAIADEHMGGYEPTASKDELVTALTRGMEAHCVSVARKKFEYASPQPALAGLETWGFTWHEFVCGLPSLLFVATTYKSNGKPNACLQSWATFNSNHAVLSSVNTSGHLYQTVKETGVVVLNFPSADVYPLCANTVKNNGFDDDELALSGLTAEPAAIVNAPRIKECFLNLECRFLWEKQIAEGDGHMLMCFEIVNVAISPEHLDENQKGRFGETGLLYNIHHTINPETFGGTAHDYLATLSKTVDMGEY